MGREANSRKSRQCVDCGQSIHADARGLKEHAGLCGRLAKLNLVMPGLITGDIVYQELKRADPRKRRM